MIQVKRLFILFQLGMLMLHSIALRDRSTLR